MITLLVGLIFQLSTRTPETLICFGDFCQVLEPARTVATLSDKQEKFSQLAAKLIQKAALMGYGVTLGEAWRSAEQSAFQTKINAEKGIGIANSLHTQRLAIDINLFKDGKFLTNLSDYKRLGEWWEKQCPECSWGGRFKIVDAPHFSFSHNGVK